MTTIFKKYTSFVFASLLFVALFNGCHKKDTLGNTSVCPSSSFKVTTKFKLSLNSVNPVTDKLTMVAGFSEKIQWWITIRGTKSGATKTYSGKSDSLNLTYFGNSETDVFFQAEECEVVFEMACGYEGSTTHFTYTVAPSIQNPDFGTLLTNFDGYPTTNAYSAGGGWGNDPVKQIINPTDVKGDPSPQGGKAYMYLGFVKDSLKVPPILLWYYGGFTSGISTAITALTDVYKVTNPDSIYLNMYVRGYATDYPNTQLQLTLEGLSESTESGMVPEAKAYNLSINWDGWKMVSIKFSDFKNLHPFTTIKTDNYKISSLVMGLGAGPNQNNKSKVLVDFMIITVRAPYKEIQKRNY